MSVQYEAEIYRANKSWLVKVPQLKGFLIQARELNEELLQLIRQRIAEVTEADPTDVDVVIVDVQVPAADGSTRHLLEEIVQVRARKRALEEQALDGVRDFLAELNDLNDPGRIPVRDLGFLMQFHWSRIGQLARESKLRRTDPDEPPSSRPTPKPDLPPGLVPRSNSGKKGKRSR